MNLRTLLSVYAFLIVLGGLMFLLLPTQNLALYGHVSPSAVAVLLSRFAGTMGIALGIIAWGARRAPASPARDAIVLGITLANALGTVVTTLGAFSGEFNKMAWVPVVAYVVFTALFAVAGRANMTPKEATAA